MATLVAFEIMVMGELMHAIPHDQLSWSSGWCRGPLSSSGRFRSFDRKGSGLRVWRRDLPLAAKIPSSSQRGDVEKLWRDYFSDPSQWWDNRAEKANSRHPDFKHKRTQESLWLDNKLNPPWVEAEVAVMAPAIAIEADLFTLNKMLSAYVKAGNFKKALLFFQKMQQEGINPDRYTFVPVLNACGSLQALDEGRRIHADVIRCGCQSDLYVGSCLVNMYAKCGSITDARKVFKDLPARDVFTWSTMILGCVKCGQGQEALELYQQMQLEGVKPNPVTFNGVVNACTSLEALEVGRCVHEHIIRSGYETEVFVASSLVDMYAKCGCIEDAWAVFKKMPTRTVVSWNNMILGFVKSGQGLKALELSRRMEVEGVEPNSVTFVGMVNGCASVAALDEGRCIHEHIIQRGYESDIYVGSCLVDMYAKCGSIKDAWRVFKKMPMRNVVAWSAMIQGFVKFGEGQKALELYEQMQLEGVELNSVTFVGVLNACAIMVSIAHGRRIHQHIIQRGLELDHFVGSSLVDMYCKCGSIEDAWRVFDKMPNRDVVTWSSMILGYAKCGEEQKALELSWRMDREGIEPNSLTFVAILNACASAASLEEGRRVHKRITESGCESDVFVGSSLVDMYAKCGSIDDAWGVFKKMPTRNVVSWNAMLAGYAIHGHAKEALLHFGRMCHEGVQMNEVTFVHLLSACSHRGLVDEGLYCFESMSSLHNIPATLDHYACMIDLLGRAGCLHEAEDLMKTMPCEPNVAVWMCLLGACRVHGNLEMAERATKEVLGLDPGNSSAYVLLSSLYATAGKSDSIVTMKC